MTHAAYHRVCSMGPSGKQFKITLYKMKAFNRKGQCVKTRYTPIRADPASTDLAQPVVGLAEDFLSLWGVPGTLNHSPA